MTSRLDARSPQSASRDKSATRRSRRLGGEDNAETPPGRMGPRSSRVEFGVEDDWMDGDGLCFSQWTEHRIALYCPQQRSRRHEKTPSGPSDKA